MVHFDVKVENLEKNWPLTIDLARRCSEKLPETFNGNNNKKSWSLPKAEKDAEFVKGLDQIVVSDIKKECIVSEDKLLIESTECTISMAFLPTGLHALCWY